MPAIFTKERDIVDFLLANKNEHLQALIGTKIKKVETEVMIPKGLPRKGVTGAARIDILVIDKEDRWHIVEVKHPKSEILENSKGIAQLLFYDAMIHEKEKVNVASMNLITSSFDPILGEIVPRNNLKIRVAKATKDGLELVVGYTYKRGRPKEYRDYFVDEVYKYILECVEASKGERVCLPTVEGLAIKLGFTKETIYKWGEENGDFSDALAFLKSNQCVELINNGLSNKYNAQIAKLMLSSNHGMRERKDVTTDDEKFPTPILDYVSKD